MYKKHLEFKAKTLDHNSQNNEQAVAMTKQVQALEERMQVLERIVTDEGYSLQKELNKL
jgi:phage shock protein C